MSNLSLANDEEIMLLALRNIVRNNELGLDIYLSTSSEESSDSELPWSRNRRLSLNANHELSMPDDSYSPPPVPSDCVPDDENDSRPPEDVEIPEKECSICQESILENTPSTITPCLHTFHFGCMRTWLMGNNTCPDCGGSLANTNNAQEHEQALSPL